MGAWSFGIHLMQPKTTLQAEHTDLTSIKKQRKTELGKINYKEKKQQVLDIKLVDPAMSKKWGLKATDAELAWKKHNVLGSKDIVIAIIDTGLDINHPDLKNNLWVNPGEMGRDSQGRLKANNGIDDDQNGYIDDVHGWNFVSNNNDLSDHHGHGTHISGIVGAESGNGIGISGMAPKVSLMTLKYFDPTVSGGNNLMNTVRAIQYATLMKRKLKIKSLIINYSGGGLEESPQEKQAIIAAQKEGILLVAAAGNESSDSNVHGPQYFPADYNLSNIISVTAIDKAKNILSTSNYGMNTVDIAAPGNEIYSTLPGGRYGSMTGTSQATAFVTGVAALIMTKYPDFSAEKVIKHITQTGDKETKKLAGKTRYQTRLNTYRALAFQDQGVNFNGSVALNTPRGINSIGGNTTFSSDPNLSYPETGQTADGIAQFSRSMKTLLNEK
ncbi:MAG: S8 family serine peptidase [Bdellovibrionales bacterium]|nr:S8 family serine peptidase [Bdellovibrionales bacterium]